MARMDNFGFRVSDAERAMIALLAERLQRLQSDAVRLLIREAARELAEQNHAASNAARDAMQQGVTQYATS